MRVTRQQIQTIISQEYKKLLKEMHELDDMQADDGMNMFGAGYAAGSTDEEEHGHVHDENCGHMDSDSSQEHDDESSMFRSHLVSITNQAKELEGLVQQGENVEEWVQEKMAVAASMIDSIYHYISGSEESSAEMDDYDSDDMDSEMDQDYDEYDDEMDDEAEEETDEYDDEMDMDDEYDDEVEDDESEEDMDDEYYDDEMDDEEKEHEEDDEYDDELYEQSDYVGMDPAQYPEYGYKKVRRQYTHPLDTRWVRQYACASMVEVQVNILNNIQKIIPDSNWKSRTNYTNMTVCYSGKCPGYQVKIVETFDNRFDVNVKTNTNSYRATYSDSEQLLTELPLALNELDSQC